jgi:hypothetical protein
MDDLSVCIHAFVTDSDGNQTYCDFDAGEVPSGWCVYTRRDSDNGLPFDIDDETDFPASEYIAAYTEACDRANKLGARVIRY